MRYKTLFLFAVAIATVFPGAVYGQAEAAVTLTATVLPSSGHGTSAGLVTAYRAGVEGSAGQDESADPAVGQDAAPPGEFSRSGTSRKQLVVRAQNEVLVEVQTPSAVTRSVVSFSAGGTERVGVGTLEEETRVDIIHLSI